MVDTIKFSEMTDGGDIDNNKKVPGLKNSGNVLFNVPWTFLPSGNTASRPIPSPEMYYRLRFNTEIQLYEYYDNVLGAWTQLQESAFTAGPFVIYTADPSIPDGQNLALLSDGILKQIVTAGIATIANAINGIDFYGPGFVIPSADGGTGVNNGIHTATFAGNLNFANSFATVGNFPVIQNYTGATNVIFPLSGTLATVGESSGHVATGNINELAYYAIAGDTVSGLSTANNGVLVTSPFGVPSISSTLPVGLTIPGYQVTITPAALTKVDDTNVTLTLGGSPSTALLNATSLTLSWTGVLSGTRGGTGVNNSTRTATYAGNLNFANSFTTVGNFAVTQTYTGTTNVTFPTAGTLATTAQVITNVSQATSSATLTANNRYATNNGASLVTYTIPAGATVGDTYIIVGGSAGGWLVAQPASVQCHLGSIATTSGTGGSLASSNQYDCITITCVAANTFSVYGVQGNITIV